MFRSFTVSVSEFRFFVNCEVKFTCQLLRVLLPHVNLLLASKVRLLVDRSDPVLSVVPAPEEQPMQSVIERDFEKVFAFLESGGPDGIAGAKGALMELKDKLGAMTGMSSRTKGGLQYRAMCILDSVLLADNLRHLTTETDLLPEVCQQLLDSSTVAAAVVVVDC